MTINSLQILFYQPIGVRLVNNKQDFCNFSTWRWSGARRHGMSGSPHHALYHVWGRGEGLLRWGLVVMLVLFISEIRGAESPSKKIHSRWKIVLKTRIGHASIAVISANKTSSHKQFNSWCLQLVHGFQILSTRNQPCWAYVAPLHNWVLIFQTSHWGKLFWETNKKCPLKLHWVTVMVNRWNWWGLNSECLVVVLN